MDGRSDRPHIKADKVKIRDDTDLDERIAILEDCLPDPIEKIMQDQPGINYRHAVNRAKKQIKEQAEREIAARKPDDGTLNQVLDYF